jgi:hypothetical protein
MRSPLLGICKVKSKRSVFPSPNYNSFRTKTPIRKAVKFGESSLSNLAGTKYYLTRSQTLVLPNRDTPRSVLMIFFAIIMSICDPGFNRLFYLCRMTDEEIIDYFKTAVLSDILRLDRACTQHEVKEYVPRNIELMLSNPKDPGARHRLLNMINALEHPYDGPGIPGS